MGRRPAGSYKGCGVTYIYKLGVFALWFIHSHSDATGIFRNAFCEIGALTTSGNRVSHIVSSQDDAVAGLLGR